MADGTLLIADSGNNCIRKVGADGKISTVAGNGKDGSGGNHGPATAAQLSQPGGIVALADGTLFIADTGNNRIRKVGADGKITTVVGKGQEGRAPSPFKQLRNPHGLAALPDGTVFFSNAIDHRIWKMSADGKTLAVAAGSGEVDFSGMGGYGGDGGPATAAQLNLPDGLAVMADGTLFIADHENHRVRRVGTDGKISTVAGNGNAGFSGDDGPAVAAQLWSPRGVAVTGNGTLYIADSVNHRVRRVEGR